MTSALRLEAGARPWDPGAGAVVGEVLDRYDRPLAGLLQSADGRRTLYTCVAGRADTWSVWAFTEISPEEGSALEEAVDLDKVLADVLSSRGCTLALASDSDGIVHLATAGTAEEIPGAVMSLLGSAPAEVRSGAIRNWFKEVHVSQGLQLQESSSQTEASGWLLDGPGRPFRDWAIKHNRPFETLEPGVNGAAC